MSAVTFTINPEFVGRVVGSKGKTIRRLRYTFHSDIKIGTEGEVEIANGEADAMAKARTYIESLCDPEAKRERLPRPPQSARRAAKKEKAAAAGKDAGEGKKAEAKKGKDAAPAKKKKRTGRSTREKVEEALKEADVVTLEVSHPAPLVRSTLVLRGRGFNQARRAEQQAKGLIEFDQAPLKPVDADGKPLRFAEAAAAVEKLGKIKITLRAASKDGAEKLRDAVAEIIKDGVEREKEREERRVAAEKQRQETADRRAKMQSITVTLKVSPRSVFRNREELQQKCEGVEFVTIRDKESKESSVIIYAATEAAAQAAAAELNKRQEESIARRDEKKAAAQAAAATAAQ